LILDVVKKRCNAVRRATRQCSCTKTSLLFIFIDYRIFGIFWLLSWVCQE